MENLSISGVLLIPLILGVVEFMKDYGVSGKWSRLLAVVIGCLLGGLWYGIDQGLVPAAWLPYIGLVIFGLGFGLGIPGLYDLSMRYFVKKA